MIGKKEKPVFFESKVKADYVSAALKGKRAKKDEKKQILIPNIGVRIRDCDSNYWNFLSYKSDYLGDTIYGSRAAQNANPENANRYTSLR